MARTAKLILNLPPLIITKKAVVKNTTRIIITIMVKRATRDIKDTIIMNTAKKAIIIMKDIKVTTKNMEDIKNTTTMTTATITNTIMVRKVKRDTDLKKRVIITKDILLKDIMVFTK